MKFAFLPVQAFEDINYDFEQLQGVSVLDIEFGAGTVTWPGGTPLSDALTVSHSLGSVPSTILLTADGSAGNGGAACLASSTAATGDSFQVLLRDVNNANVALGSPGLFYWLAAP